MQKSRCPICHSDVIIDDESIKGDMVNCSNCESDLEITALHPLLLTKIEEEPNQ